MCGRHKVEHVLRVIKCQFGALSRVGQERGPDVHAGGSGKSLHGEGKADGGVDNLAQSPISSGQMARKLAQITPNPKCEIPKKRCSELP